MTHLVTFEALAADVGTDENRKAKRGGTERYTNQQRELAPICRNNRRMHQSTKPKICICASLVAIRPNELSQGWPAGCAAMFLPFFSSLQNAQTKNRPAGFNRHIPKPHQTVCDAAFHIPNSPAGKAISSSSSSAVPSPASTSTRIRPSHPSFQPVVLPPGLDRVYDLLSASGRRAAEDAVLVEGGPVPGCGARARHPPRTCACSRWCRCRATDLFVGATGDGDLAPALGRPDVELCAWGRWHAVVLRFCG